MEFDSPSPLVHARQTLLYGCMYHAVYAILGDSRLLTHVEDVSQARWLARLAEYGYAVQTLYSTHWTLCPQPLGTQDWEGLRGLIRQAGLTHLPVLLTIRSRRVQGYHLVAAQIPQREGDTVVISDSVEPDVLTLSWAAFLDSRYAQVFAIEQPISRELDMHVFIPAQPVPLEPLV